MINKETVVVIDCQISLVSDDHIVAIVGINIRAGYKFLPFSVEPVDAAAGSTEIKGTVVAFYHALYIILSQSVFTVLVDILLFWIVHVDTDNLLPVGYPKVILRIYQKIASLCVCFRSLGK